MDYVRWAFARTAVDVALVFLAGRGTRSCPPCICQCAAGDLEATWLGLVERQLGRCPLPVAGPPVGSFAEALLILLAGIALGVLLTLRVVEGRWCLRPAPGPPAAAALGDHEVEPPSRFSCPECHTPGFSTLEEAVAHCPKGRSTDSKGPQVATFKDAAREQARRRRAPVSHDSQSA